MIKNLDPLFKYLQKENISIDKAEFTFQIQTHPDFPTLLSISDTLSFFKINNGALRVPLSEIDLLPSNFLALLKKNDSREEIFLIEKKENNIYVCSNNNDRIEISKTELETRWQNIVLLIEKNENTKILIKKPNIISKILIFTNIFLLSLLLYFYEIKLDNILFFLFTLLGLFFSLTALKDLLNTKIELIETFCKISSNTNCNIINSPNKLKIFKYINFSDLSIVFFSTQLFGFLTFAVNNNLNDYNIIQLILLLASLPSILISLYFQKYIEKKWCPICLSIIFIILAELFFLILIGIEFSEIKLKSIILYISLYTFMTLSWFILNKNLKKQKEMRDLQFKSIRFIRNYKIFKKLLLDNPQKTLPYSPIILGNIDSKLEITIITNPFCSFCKSAHDILNSILEKHNEHLKVTVIFKTNLKHENENGKLLFKTLMNIYLKFGEDKFKESLSFWFENKNIIEWLKLYQKYYNDDIGIDVIFNTQNDWCINEIAFTPTIFINGYEFPNEYERENLPYFINDLIEDFL